MTLSNMELVHLVTRAYDQGFRHALPPELSLRTINDVVTSPSYLAVRDDWVRAQVPEGTTA